MQEFITREEIDKMLNNTGIEVVDKLENCNRNINHIHSEVEEYLMNKWQNNKDENDEELINTGKELLKEFKEDL